MEAGECKRARKAVNYALLDCSDDDDFSEFTPPVKKKKDYKDTSEKSSLSDESRSSDKSRSSSSQESSSSHHRDKDRDKRRDKEKDKKRKDRDKDRDGDRERRDKEKDSKRKDGDRERRDREKDEKRKDERRDKEKDEKRKDKDRHRKDRDHDRRDREKDEKKNDSDREKRDKEKDEKRKDKDQHKVSGNSDKRDSDSDRGDKGNDRPLMTDKPLAKEDSIEDKNTPISAEGKDKKDEGKENREKDDVKKLVEDNDPDFKDTICSPKSNRQPLTSTQKSPGRASPRKRLTVEERMFQRELEAALAISKMESGDCSDEQKPPGKEVKGDASSGNAKPKDSSNSEACKNPDIDEPNQEKVTKEENKNDSPQEASDNSAATGKVEKEDKAKDGTSRKSKVSGTTISTVSEIDDEPVPSTSSGMTSKRQRKKVVFFEESDSESFDGFDSSEMSEESDFAPSPVKKGKKSKEPKKAKPSKPPKTKAKEQRIKSNPVKSPPQPKITAKQSLKENTIPVVNGASSPSVSASTVTKVPDIKSPPRKVAVKSTPRTPTTTPKEKSKVISSNVTLPKAVDTSKSGVVKTPFRSPIQSTGTTPNFVPKSPNPLQRIGVRVGLSRTNFKPLHPGAVAK